MKTIRRFYKTIFRQLPQEFLRELFRRMFLSLLQQLLRRLKKRFPRHILPDTFRLATAALELPPPGEGKPKNVTTSRPGMNLLQLHQSLRLAKLMPTLNRQQATPDLFVPPPRNGTFESPSPSTDKIVYAKDEINLTKESSRLYRIRKDKLRAKRQISPDVATELNLNDAQLNSLQSQVN